MTNHLLRGGSDLFFFYYVTFYQYYSPDGRQADYSAGKMAD